MAKKLTFQLDLSDYTPAQREAIAIEVMDKIIARTQQGKDKNGNKFAPYSKGYKDSVNFKIGGKSSSVDLTLSGDMLDSMEIVKNGPKVEIGYSAGNPERGKAEGNILGTYGQSKPTAPARDFLGIQESELDRILRKYPSGTQKAEQRAKETLIKEGESARLSGRIRVEDFEDDE